MEKTAKSIEDLFPLIEACKVGDLKKVAAWILERRISSFGSDLRWSQSPSTKEDLEVIRFLVSQGAKWVPDENTYRTQRPNRSPQPIYR